MAETLSHQHYSIQARLGQGGMGAVYLAFDTRLQRQVAIKCIRAPESSLQQQWLWSDAFQEEARLLAQINHPNIVQIYDLIEWDDQPALVMEYVQGRTLLDILRSDELMKPSLTLDTRLDWLTQIARGLAAAHAKGIIHRDLKPENIMITGDGLVKIMDFGIARHQDQSLADNIHDSQALPGEFVGSPGALSPEQALGEPLTTASDIFSFGILAYSLLCGHHPFGDTSDPDGLLQNILYRAPIGFVPLGCLTVSAAEQAELAIITMECMNKAAQCRPTAETCASSFCTVTKTPETTDLHTTNKAGFRLAWQSALALVFIFIAYGLFTELNPKPLKHIAILSPATGTIENPDANTYSVAYTAFSDTLFQRLESIPDSTLVNPEEWPESASAEDVLRTTGATHIILPKLACSIHRCDLSLTSYKRTGGKLTLTGKKQWQVIADSMEDIYLTTWQYSANLLQESQTKPDTISEEDYRTYLRLLGNFLKNAKLSNDELNELITLSQREPIFVPALMLRTRVAISLYKDSNNSTHLQLTKNLLDKNRDKISNKNFYARSAEIFIALSDFEKARELLQQLRADGYNYKYHEILADLLIRENEFDKAIEQLTQLLNIRSSDKILYSIAYCHYATGNLDAAEENLSTILERSPDDARASAFLAGLFITQGKYKQAISLITNSPKRLELPSNLNNLSIAYMLTGDYKHAEKIQQKVLEISPDNPTRLNQMGEIYLAQGNLVAAEYYFSQALLKLRSTNDISDFIVGATADIHLGRLDEAKKKLDKAKSIQKQNSEIAYAETIHQIKLGNHKEALQLMQKNLQDGYSLEWFSFPWFSDLCQFTEYNELFNKAGQRTPCFTGNNITAE